MTARKKKPVDPNSTWNRRTRQIYEDNGGDLNSDFRHSTYYHSYFSGYAEKLVPRRGAKGSKIERVYVGRRYSVIGSDGDFRRIKLSRFLLYLISVVLYILGVVSNAPSNLQTVPSVLCAVTILVEVIGAAVVVEYLCTPKEMTEHEYTASHMRLKTVSMVLLVLQLLCCAAKAAAALVIRSGQVQRELGSLALTLLAAAVMLVLNRTENAVRFHEDDSEYDIPDGSSLIQ